MSETNGQPIQNRYDFVLFFDVTDANPNGDPDAGNLPRVDPETGQGLVTDVCLKRKVRNYVALSREDAERYHIYVTERAILNQQHEKAYAAVNEGKDKKEQVKPSKNLPKDAARARELTQWMCHNFFDIRAFGAVMTTDVNCGQVRGPVQFGIARSLHPIVSQDISVTRCAVTTEREAEKQEGGNRTMGRKFAVPYALYRVHGYINPNLADGEKGTGFSEIDLELLKEALDRLFEFDASAARPPGSMKPVACVAFKHDKKLGNARADQLFKRVTSLPKPGIQPLPNQRDDQGNPVEPKADDRPARSAEDYVIAVDEADLPAGVSVERWVDWG
jgi:CRISPR-associated protein Csd2